MIRLHYHRTCDRCSEPFEEKVANSTEDLPIRKTLDIKLIAGTTTLLEWHDLCDSCKKAVDNLVDRLRLSPKKTSPTIVPEPETTPEQP